MTGHTHNIAIIGAGIAGLYSAYTLLKQGQHIHLYSSAPLPAINSASYIAGGMLAPYSEIDHMSGEFIEASLTSIDLWRSFIQNEAPHVPFTDNGSILLAHTQDQYILQRFESHLPEGSFTPLNRAQIQAHEPLINPSFTSALHIPQEAAIHPQEALKALSEHIQNHKNAQIHISTPAPADLTNQYDHIIDCRGIAARDNQQALRGVKGEIAIVRNREFTLNHTLRIMHPRYPLYIVPRPDNIFMIGATQIEAAPDAHESNNKHQLRSTLELLSALYSLAPSFADATIEALHSGIRPAYPDNLPKITLDGKIISCNGLFRHGFLLAPIMAQEIAAIIQGNTTHEHHNSLFRQQ